jgi:hypothetical protein
VYPFTVKIQIVLLVPSVRVEHLSSVYFVAFSYARYHPSKGYWWEFKESESKGNKLIRDF